MFNVNNTKVFICGDIHAEWGIINKKINKIQHKNKNCNCIILVTGDFGWFPKDHAVNKNTIRNNIYNIYGRKIKPFNQYGLKIPDNVFIYFCDGNHEDHSSLDNMKKHFYGIISIMKNVYYCPFGTQITINGKNILFCGGATSWDKDGFPAENIPPRIENIDWWPQETIDDNDMQHLPENHIDIVVSHTCPTKFELSLKGDAILKQDDISRKYLDIVLKKYNPSKWYFGHFHKMMQGKNEGCEWICMPHSTSLQRFIIEVDI